MSTIALSSSSSAPDPLIVPQPQHVDDEAASDDDDEGGVVAVDPVRIDVGTGKPGIPMSRIDRFLRGYTIFMSSPLRQDRSLKLLQYTLWAAAQAYGKDSKGRAGLVKLSLDLCFTRVANRLLGFPTALEAARSGSWAVPSQRHPQLFRALGKFLAWTMVGYYPTEHVAYLHWMAPSWLASGRSAEVFSAWSCRCWTAYILAESAQCILQWRELAYNDRVPAVNEDDNYEKEHKLNLERTRSECRHLELQLVRNALWILPAVHWSLPNWDRNPLLSSGTLNTLMFLESLVSMYQTVRSFPTM
jgi:hypothetical protein